MNLKTRLDLLWPVHEFHPTDGLPEHLVPGTRLRNRWRVDRLLPYIRRWVLLAAVFGVVAGLGEELPRGALGLMLYALGRFGCLGSMFLAGFWGWLYLAYRPK